MLGESSPGLGAVSPTGLVLPIRLTAGGTAPAHHRPVKLHHKLLLLTSTILTPAASFAQVPWPLPMYSQGARTAAPNCTATGGFGTFIATTVGEVTNSHSTQTLTVVCGIDLGADFFADDLYKVVAVLHRAHPTAVVRARLCISEPFEGPNGKITLCGSWKSAPAQSGYPQAVSLFPPSADPSTPWTDQSYAFLQVEIPAGDPTHLGFYSFTPYRTLVAVLPAP